MKKFLRGILVQHVDVQLALAFESGHGEVAAAEVGNDRIDGILPVRKVEFCMERVLEEELHMQAFFPELLDQPLETRLVRVCGVANGELLPEFPRRVLPEFRERLEIGLTLSFPGDEFPKLVVGQPLHPDKKAGRSGIIRMGRHFPRADHIVDAPPAPEIEISDTEIAPFREFQGMLQTVV